MEDISITFNYLNLTDINGLLYPATAEYTFFQVHMRHCCCLVARPCPTLCWTDPMVCSLLLCPWDFSGKNTGVDCHFLLQGIFLIQGSNPYLLHLAGGSCMAEPPGTPSLDIYQDNPNKGNE